MSPSSHCQMLKLKQDFEVMRADINRSLAATQMFHLEGKQQMVSSELATTRTLIDDQLWKIEQKLETLHLSLKTDFQRTKKLSKTVQELQSCCSVVNVNIEEKNEANLTLHSGEKR